jgi:predicted nucleotidyltransferase
VNPTVYPDLNAVLRELVASVRTILAENLCGAYLQGSFALGDADRHSDVDFLVVSNDEVSDGQLGALQAMHERIYGLHVPWAQHLEGSYIPKSSLRQVDRSRRSFLYLDNGASRLIWDNHCNTAVVRWTLRERGVVLEGPDPETLVEPVSAAELRREALAGVREYAEWVLKPTKAGPMSRWKQPYLVLTFCRLLHTLAEGHVASKREASEWALRMLDPRWVTLVQQAVDDRADPWARVHQPADPDLVARTLAFADYALVDAGRFEKKRSRTPLEGHS